MLKTSVGNGGNLTLRGNGSNKGGRARLCSGIPSCLATASTWRRGHVFLPDFVVVFQAHAQIDYYGAADGFESLPVVGQISSLAFEEARLLSLASADKAHGLSGGEKLARELARNGPTSTKDRMQTSGGRGRIRVSCHKSGWLLEWRERGSESVKKRVRHKSCAWIRGQPQSKALQSAGGIESPLNEVRPHPVHHPRPISFFPELGEDSSHIAKCGKIGQFRDTKL
jgi:hypothetical protein